MWHTEYPFPAVEPGEAAPTTLIAPHSAFGVRRRGGRSVTDPGGHRATAWSTCNAGGVTTYGIRFEGPSALTLPVATALADADGVELISSDQPVNVADGKVALNVAVEGAFDAVADAVAKVRGDLPSDASIEITGT